MRRAITAAALLLVCSGDAFAQGQARFSLDSTVESDIFRGQNAATRPGIVIDITGVATVDTLVAQHLMKTIAAARLMGADCIISGIRPQIAQTIVHLGIDLQGVTTKATLADALRLAMKRAGYAVTRD